MWRGGFVPPPIRVPPSRPAHPSRPKAPAKPLPKPTNRGAFQSVHRHPLQGCVRMCTGVLFPYGSVHFRTYYGGNRDTSGRLSVLTGTYYIFVRVPFPPRNTAPKSAHFTPAFTALNPSVYLSRMKGGPSPLMHHRPSVRLHAPSRATTSGPLISLSICSCLPCDAMGRAVSYAGVCGQATQWRTRTRQPETARPWAW